MLKDFKDKALKKIRKEYDETVGAVSEGTVKLILQKDLGGFASKYKKDIHKYYNYFMHNYIKILKYMKKDFKLKNANGVKISKEIEDCEDHYKKYGGKKNVFQRIGAVGGVKPMMFLLEKLRTINIIFDEYPPLLKEFKVLIKGNEYKDIDIRYERYEIDNAKFLDTPEIGILTKEVNKDLEAKKDGG